MFLTRMKKKELSREQLADHECIYASYHHKLHSQALEQLKNKKGKINVLFFVLNVSCWKFDSVYWKMSKSKRYNPIILVCPQCNLGEDFKMEQLQSCYDYFYERGYRVVNSYDKATGTYVDARMLFPDIIFYTSPYQGLIDDRYYISHFPDVLTCYTNYYFLNNDVYWGASLPLHKSVWKYFCEYDFTRHYGKVGTRLYYDNRVVVGYPMYDCFVDKTFSGSDWKQQDSSKKRIIYAPHHSIETDGWIHYSTFLSVYDVMAELRDKYKDQIQFVFKPHPLLKVKLYNTDGWGKERTDAYYQAWADAENSAVVDINYVDLFKSSDAMIHDCSSFVSEYLYVQKPVMHLSREGIEKVLNPEVKEAYQAHYLMDEIGDIEKFITEVVIGGKDPKKEERKKVFKKLLVPPHNRLVADNILNEIDRELSCGIKRIYINLKSALCQVFKM